MIGSLAFGAQCLAPGQHAGQHRVHRPGGNTRLGHGGVGSGGYRRAVVVPGSLGFAIGVAGLFRRITGIRVVGGGLLIVTLVLVRGGIVPDVAVVALIVGAVVGVASAMIVVSDFAAVFAMVIAMIAAIAVVALDPVAAGAVAIVASGAGVVVKAVAAVVGLLAVVMIGGLNRLDTLGNKG